ncbi:MAG TPA: UvrD-helicase domain-containing protein [Blastocatellia bacterium]|nr:UvrD-helicase domain-containing protein [Blastocatellia bacterium]
MIETKTRELKPEQRTAAHTLDRHVSVTAGPGAGKTTVLVERYLHILRTHDVGVDQIVAITFTNRAANEMRERLRVELDKLLGATCETPAQSGSIERAKWMRHKRTLDGAIITTIHGFCARLLREFPVEAGIDPQFALLDAHRSAMLEETVAEESLTELISAGSRDVITQLAGVGRARLARGLIGIYRSMRNQGLTVEMLGAAVDKSHRTIEDYRGEVELLSAKMREFIHARGLTPSAGKKRVEAESRWPRLLEFLEGASESTSVAEFCGNVEEFRRVARPGAQGKISELVKDLDKLIWENNLRGSVAQAFFDLSARQYAKALIRGVASVEQGLGEEKRRTSSLDFDDLQVRAFRLLEEHPEVLRRTSGRYRFFLVDEFQDTNGLQGGLMAMLALGGADSGLRERLRANSPDGGETPIANRSLNFAQRANLFIVGDRKQSIYGFRGADVDVFREMTSRIERQGGLPVKLSRNFRSQKPLIQFFNALFEGVFERDPAITADELNELGYVEHEASIAAREDQDAPPVVELLVDLRPDDRRSERMNSLLRGDGGATDSLVRGKGEAPLEPGGDEAAQQPEQKPRERDSEQLATRIISLVRGESISVAGPDGASSKRKLEYRDIAMLFRAMTEVHLYESALRRAGVPYVTVDGKGFYAREEITDFIQLLRFLDNKTDEVALAAVLRSPICGLSDDALLALRCGPLQTKAIDHDRLQRRHGVRPLLDAIGSYELIDLIDASDRKALERARELLGALNSRAKRSRLSELLRFAIDASEYRLVAAASFDGAGRLANIEKLLTLAQRFERSGAYLIRDFVRFVHEFEEAGGRESEGQLDDTADAVRLMSIHQSKGLEFPVVVVPDLHRLPDNRREWWALDRHHGLTLKIPDGRGRLVAGSAFSAFAERQKRREEFESMRLLYVAATRAKDKLILSGATKDLSGLRGSWLGWISKALGLSAQPESGVLTTSEGIEIRATVNLADASTHPGSSEAGGVDRELIPPPGEDFPLLERIKPQHAIGLHRFSVTQLLNYRRCPRQYYFDRVLHTPPEDQVAVWNDADAPEPPANLTATLKGAVIHRFCETFTVGDDLHERLRSSFTEVLKQREAQVSERLVEIDPEKALRDLLPLAGNYVSSRVRERIERARADAQQSDLSTQGLPLGVTSELRFRLRRPLGLVTGTIDKLVIYQSPAGLNAEIIDFKTNRFHARSEAHEVSEREQLAFDFARGAREQSSPLRAEVDATATDYRLQMQAYALAMRELMPTVSRVKVTLHFLDPDIEVSLPDSLLEREAASRAIDEAMAALVGSSGPESFQPQPARHCRVCNFLALCEPGRTWLSETGGFES